MRPKTGGRWPGTWKAICDRCGRLFPSDKLQKDWQGLMVCAKDFETRHPQDFLRAMPEKGSVPWSRPEAGDTFVVVCDIFGSSGYADMATADCARADSPTLPYQTLLDLTTNGH